MYVAMPKQFNGRVVGAWLEKFETWFRHREQVEGIIQEIRCIEPAIQNMKPETSLDLIHYEAAHG